MSNGYNTDIELNELPNVDIELGEVVAVGGGISKETDPTVPSYVKQITQEDITSWNSKASSDEIPTKTSELTNDSGFITGYTESDPTVPSFVKNITQGNINSWNAKAEKSDIPRNVSELINDKGYITSYTETDPTVPSWAKQPNKPNYSYDEITGKPTDLATESYVKNEIANAQLGGGGSDIDLSGYATKDDLTGKADKSELNNYVTNDALANKGYLTAIPDEYVTDTELSDKGYLTAVPSEYITETELSRKGYLTDVPSDYKTKSENDELYQAKGNYLTEETDPSVPAYVKNISENDISNWNNKSEFSGSYDDLTNKPTIPTVPTDISAFNNDKGYLTSVPSEYVTETELVGKGYATTTELENSVKDKATTSYVDKKVADLVNSAPTTLDTLGEVATAIQNNASVVEALNSAIGNKVDKVSGKGLSTNDYTSAEKTKLAGLSNYDDTEIKSQINSKANKTDIPTKTSQLTNDSGFMTELTQDQLNKIVDAVVEAQKVEFVDSVEEMKDTSKRYVLPDGYIYTYTEKSVLVKHELNDGTGLINVRPVTNSTMDKTQDASGVWTSPILEINPSEFGPTADRINETTVTINGLEKLVPAFNNSSVWVWFYDASGNKLHVLKGLQFTELTDTEITLPISFLLRASSVFNSTLWAKVKYIRIVLGISTSGNITANDVSNLSVNIPFFDYETLKYGWYSTGHMYNKDEYTEAIEQNASNIETLQTDVATLKEAVKTTPSQSGAVWYAVGDSITKGYGVGADNCWVKYVLDYNGYDKEKSKNLGISGLGFAKSDPNYSKTARTVVDENDFTNVDLVTIAIGINDWKEPFSIDTVKSEMGYCFEKILTDNPYCKIIFIVPFNIWLKGSANTNWALGYSGSDVTGGTLQNFIDAQKSVCEQYGIQIIDMTNNSVINKVNIETVLYDKIHPNAECHIALGRELARRITYA